LEKRKEKMKMDLKVFGKLGKHLFDRKNYYLSLTLSLMTALVGLASGTPVQAAAGSENWIGIWSASPIPFTRTGITKKGFTNTTLRMIVHPHIDGSKVRIKLSNVFGINPVTFDSVHVALQERDARILQGTDRKVTFESGRSAVTIQAGAEVWSDPIDLQIVDRHNLAVSVYIAGSSGPATFHNKALQINYLAQQGDHTEDIQEDAYVKTMSSYFWLSGVEAVTDDTVKGVLVTLGDSITDGNGSTRNANHRYPDYLAERIRSESPQYQLAVLNQGISGNRLLSDAAGNGVKALDRLERDVLQQNQLKVVILLEGINDIRHGCYDPEKIIAAMKVIIDRVHAQGARIYGGTLTPFAVANKPKVYNSNAEKTREAVNTWIRTSGAFDGVIDFDRAIRDPKNPLYMLPQYDSGDHLHPGDAGYQAMANAIDLKILKGMELPQKL
jgi:lysophospholipase L1-like esterase